MSGGEQPDVGFCISDVGEWATLCRILHFLCRILHFRDHQTSFSAIFCRFRPFPPAHWRFLSNLHSNCNRPPPPPGEAPKQPHSDRADYAKTAPPTHRATFMASFTSPTVGWSLPGLAGNPWPVREALRRGSAGRAGARATRRHRAPVQGPGFAAGVHSSAVHFPVLHLPGGDWAVWGRDARRAVVAPASAAKGSGAVQAVPAGPSWARTAIAASSLAIHWQRAALPSA